MANSFDFELTANDEASAAILRIEEIVKHLNPLLDRTRDALALGGQESRDNLDDLGSRFDVMAKNARSGVQFIGDLVPPLKMVGGLTLGLGGAAAVVNVVKNNLTNFANAGYRIDTVAKNVSMTADAFQELTGAMIENGSAREAAEGSVSELFEKANDAVHGRNDGFLALLKQRGIGISETKDGLADVGKLINDLNRAMQSLPAGQQALFANKLGLSPDLLSYLRNTTSEVQRLKDQARRDGLIFTEKDMQNALTFKQQLNQIDAAYDGMLMKGQAWLGQSETLAASVDQLKQVVTNGLDSTAIGSILTFNNGGKQADVLRQAQGDEKFKDTLSWKEKLDLKLGYASEDLINKLNGYYKPVWRADQLRADTEKISGYQAQAENGAMLPYGQPGNNALGLRNNNPGNLRSAPNTTGRNGGFVTFENPNDGLAALSRQLMLFGDRGKNTLNSIIPTYAPSSENNTQAYIDALAKQTGFNPAEPLDLHSPAVLEKLIPAIIKHENGAQPYSREQISKGISDSVFDPRWSGLRDQNKLYEQRQFDQFEKRGDSKTSEVDQAIEAHSPYQESLPPQGQREDSEVHKELFHPDNPSIVEQEQPRQEPLWQQPPRQEPLSLFSPLNEVRESSKQISEALTKALEENKLQLEITLINPQTGERRMVQTEGGARVALSMQTMG
ncbi:Uncharacterised protein [Serratia marcescens]|uniref:hypothetical protein n=1 Tax=Serratia marcescens TaxID=615 RepID=UPI00074558DE|nr:hypothetical protein [Serratia marcescens]CUZ14303.1 Uncharacterised protein [Serratia marcescens]CVD95781.1 Uncharacterised protein [Serratia marcescens]